MFACRKMHVRTIHKTCIALYTQNTDIQNTMSYGEETCDSAVGRTSDMWRGGDRILVVVCQKLLLKLVRKPWRLRQNGLTTQAGLHSLLHSLPGKETCDSAVRRTCDMWRGAEHILHTVSRKLLVKLVRKPCRLGQNGLSAQAGLHSLLRSLAGNAELHSPKSVVRKHVRSFMLFPAVLHGMFAVPTMLSVMPHSLPWKEALAVPNSLLMQ